MSRRPASTRGFKRTSTLVQDKVRRASETRGFAESRLLTHWAEIVGEDIAAIARPVKVGFGRQGLGATLTVLTTGAQAPMLEMQKEKLRERVNTVYGYNAISQVRITQTAPTGFSDGQVSFDHRPKPAQKPALDPVKQAQIETLAAPVEDTNLRSALEALGKNILSKHNH